MIDSVKRDRLNFHNYNSLLIKTITFLVFFISIGYSALNSSLMVTGDLVYRTKADIRITGVRINGVTNGGVEQYSPKYTKNTVILGMKLPNLNSTVTYEVTITNKSSNKYTISSITDEIPGNLNIGYTHNYTNTTIEANSSITVALTYKYNSSVTTLPSDVLKETKVVFAFEEASNTLYQKMKLDYKSGKAELYIGDKSTFLGDKEVYYYKGSTTNNNVIFAGFCWRMYRTTETGGVKMIYNGIPSSGQCTSTGSASTIGDTRFNPGYNSLAYAGYMYNKVYEYKTKSAVSSYLYGNSFTYSGGTYKLTSTQSMTLSTTTSSIYAALNNKHYTCWNTTGTCTTISYVYYVTGSNTYYIELTGGINIEKALDEMLYDDDVNTTNSTIKTVIDTWYKSNMTAYTGYLEDAVWCNDRSMNNQSTAGWNSNGGDVRTYLYFKPYGNSGNLICQNRNDRFTVNSTNGNGKLTYPVGLVTRQEQNLSYDSSGSSISGGTYYNWTLSPSYYHSNILYSYDVTKAGDVVTYSIYTSSGVRPTVSLKTGIEYNGGDGTSVNPFAIKT